MEEASTKFLETASWEIALEM